MMKGSMDLCQENVRTFIKEMTDVGKEDLHTALIQKAKSNINLYMQKHIRIVKKK